MKNKLLITYSHSFVIQTSIVLFILVVFSPGVFGQAADGAQHPIEKAQAECLKTRHGTMPRARCYSDAAEAWEQEVTKIYVQLVKAIEPNDKRSLENSQTAWEKYRDAEFNLLAHLYGQKKGTGYISVRIIERMEIVRQRAIELKNRLETIKSFRAFD